MYEGRTGKAQGEKYTNTPRNSPMMNTPVTDLSDFAMPILRSSASPSLAFRTALSKAPHLSKGVPVFSFATTYPSWSITRTNGIS